MKKRAPMKKGARVIIENDPASVASGKKGPAMKKGAPPPVATTGDGSATAPGSAAALDTKMQEMSPGRRLRSKAGLDHSSEAVQKRLAKIRPEDVSEVAEGVKAASDKKESDVANENAAVQAKPKAKPYLYSGCG